MPGVHALLSPSAAHRWLHCTPAPRLEALEEEKVYIQTQKYIEEKAKSIGYVYPDEIILTPEE